MLAAPSRDASRQGRFLLLTIVPDICDRDWFILDWSGAAGQRAGEQRELPARRLLAVRVDANAARGDACILLAAKCTAPGRPGPGRAGRLRLRSVVSVVPVASLPRRISEATRHSLPATRPVPNVRAGQAAAGGPVHGGDRAAGRTGLRSPTMYDVRNNATVAAFQDYGTSGAALFYPGLAP